MKRFLQYIFDYAKAVNLTVFLSSAAILALFVFLNYSLELDHKIDELDVWLRLGYWFLLFLIAFSTPYIVQYLLKKRVPSDRQFLILMVTAPLLFAWKMAAPFRVFATGDRSFDIYWNKVLYWPLKLSVIVLILVIVWKIFHTDQPFYGTSTKHFNTKPYLWMLAIMLPLVALASTQPDFLMMYPKLQHLEMQLGASLSPWQQILFELSYGSDFIGIELFFRGFLVLAFAKWAGKDAILPMALFYCTIHFGKPLGECISSFFGGIVLGVVTYHTRSIWGGLIVHLGIAWLMELGGFLGNVYLRG